MPSPAFRAAASAQRDYATPSFVASSSHVTADAQSSVVANLPAGCVANDMMIMAVRGDGTSTTITTPTGWTVLSAPLGYVKTFWKRHNGSETQVTVAFSQAEYPVIIISAFRGVSTSIDPAATSNVESVSATAHPAGTLAYGGNAIALYSATSDGSASGWTPPSGYTEAIDVARSTGGVINTGTHAYKVVTVDANESPSGTTGASIATVVTDHVRLYAGVTAKTITITKPAGTVSGDILLAFIRRNTSVSDTWTLPTGWIHQGTNTGFDWFSKIAGGAEPADYTFTYQTDVVAVGAMVAYSGGNALGGNVMTATLTTSSVTMDANSTLVVAYGVPADGSFAPDATTTERVDANGTHGRSATVMVADQLFASAGESGAKTATHTATGFENQIGNRSVAVELTSYLAPPTPTAITPASGATVTTDLPTLGATLGTGGSASSQKARWQIAEDSGFSVGLRTITEADADLRVSGATTEPLPGASELRQRVWFIRAQAVDNTGGTSAYSASHSFTVSHPPSTTGHSPTGGAYRNFGGTGQVTLSWTFSDTSPTDVQTAYQVIVERNSDGLVIVDSSKVISATQQHVATIPVAYKGIDLRWKVRLYDSDDVVGSYSAYHVFRVADNPTVAITAPAEGTTISSGRPTVTWTFTTGGGTTQTQYRVRFFQGSTTVHDSGWTLGSSTSYTPPQPVLANATTYTVTVDVIDTGGLTGTDTNTFTTQFTVPATITFTVKVTGFWENGYVRLEWGDTARDVDFTHYIVYRRALAEGEDWTNIYQDDTVVMSYIFDDYTARATVDYEYSIVQVVNRFGTTVESLR